MNIKTRKLDIQYHTFYLYFTWERDHTRSWFNVTGTDPWRYSPIKWLVTYIYISISLMQNFIISFRRRNIIVLHCNFTLLCYSKRKWHLYYPSKSLTQGITQNKFNYDQLICTSKSIHWIKYNPSNDPFYLFTTAIKLCALYAWNFMSIGFLSICAIMKKHQNASSMLHT